jgi:hypothetical protein
LCLTNHKCANIDMHSIGDPNEDRKLQELKSRTRYIAPGTSEITRLRT